jgi:hypothetical protein
MEDTFQYTTHLTLEECKTIAWWIQEENILHGKHMLEKTPEELFSHSKNWCCIIKKNNEPIWCVFLMPVEHWWITLYEWWSLFVKPEYRGQNISYFLTQKMLDNCVNLPLYAITNVPAVKKNNKKLDQHEYTKDIIPKEILSVLEVPWELLDNDVVYCNELLHVLLQQYA